MLRNTRRLSGFIVAVLAFPFAASALAKAQHHNFNEMILDGDTDAIDYVP